MDIESAELIKSVQNTIDYDRLPTCSLIFHLAVYYSSAEAFLGLCSGCADSNEGVFMKGAKLMCTREIEQSCKG